MLFDEACGFCRRWICRWRQTTGDQVEYVALQDPRVAEQFPELPGKQLEESVHLVEPGGAVYRGAEAVFHSLLWTPPTVRRPLFPRLALWLYGRVPGFALISEWAYGKVAQHRVLFSVLTRWLWGNHVERPTHVLVRALFLRLLGLVYLLAFVSLGTQILGLVGAQGIQPAADTMAYCRQQRVSLDAGLDCFRQVPTLCWWNASDSFLRFQCAAGATVSALVIIGISPAVSLSLAWVLYLSLTSVCGVFLGYQWDNLLLEAGLLAIFFAPIRFWPNFAREWRPSVLMLWLLRWLLFRLMFASGCVKLVSGDASWWGLSALRFHYETQPLPTPVSWYVHQMPGWFQAGSVLFLFSVELVAPWLMFLPRRPRFVAVWATILLMLLIALTGNYGFFNLLTVALCVTLFDDAALLKLVPQRWRTGVAKRIPGTDTGEEGGPIFSVTGVRWRRLQAVRRTAYGLVAGLIVVLTGMNMASALGYRGSADSLLRFHAWFGPFRSFNSYGLFAVMTTTRPQIIVQGSDDSEHWRDYGFRYQPGDTKYAPKFVAPLQPRLDWQLWFAALGNAGQNPWFLNFCARLLEGSPAVLALLEHDPFGGKPPRYLRAVLYEYRFTDWATRRRTGAWWRREYKGDYLPVVRSR